jgi:hypothetical protein
LDRLWFKQAVFQTKFQEVSLVSRWQNAGFKDGSSEGKRGGSFSTVEFQKFLTILGIFGQLMLKTCLCLELITRWEGTPNVKIRVSGTFSDSLWFKEWTTYA